MLSRDECIARSAQMPRCIWLTGLPAAGKTTIAYALEQRLRSDGRHAFVLDGDHLRRGLNQDLSYTVEDRVENVRRVAEVARLAVDAGLIVLVAVVSPFRSGRKMARELFARGEFAEIFVDAPLEECERRDPKGMYARARRGELRLFTGIESPYEPPADPEVRVNTSVMRIADSVDYVYERLIDLVKPSGDRS
ncbi:MAG: adenylyl-sulfate kinase [Rhodocyclaceae bacterium]|nr:MAG: adenylyl-sulfate kinase [Rhodocyclaceae bacterium]